MAGGYNRRDDRRSGSDRKETSIPAEGIIRGIVQGNDPEELVKYAEEIGKGLAKNEGLKTNQIRIFFSEVKRIEGSIQQKSVLEEQDRRRLVLLIPKLAYQAQRQIESQRNWGVARLEKVLTPAIKSVGNDVKYFRNFVDFFEAILAYHKAAGGREQ